jgi:hypothetical protein
MPIAINKEVQLELLGGAIAFPKLSKDVGN